MDQWELDMGFLENLTNDAFANKMAEHYQAQIFPAAPQMPHATDGLSPDKKADYFHTHIGAASFKSIRAEAENKNIRTPLWMAQPFMQRGIQKGQDNPSNKINFLTAPVIDTGRIAKFMGSPKGLLFIAKQAGLQLSNPKGEFLAPGPINAGRIYNPLATAAQIPAGALGIHIDRHGLGPLNPEAINYEKRIKAKTLLKSNRLVDIASQLKVGYFKSLTTSPSSFDQSEMSPLEALLAKLKNGNIYISRKKNIKAMSGLGGPGSVFGIGFTTHRTSTVTGLNGFIAISYTPDETYKELRSEGGNYVGGLGPGIEKLGDDFNPINLPAKSGDDAIIKYGALDYGGITRKGKTNDSSNAIRSFRDGTEYEDNSYSRLGLIDYGKSKGYEPDQYGEAFGSISDYVTLKLTRGSDIIRFRSYGLGSITDNTSFSWSEVKYAGRTLAQQKFESVARDVSHDLMIVSFTAMEAKQNYIRLNKLYQMASPSIKSGLATAAFCQLTLGDLYKDQNVIIDKITFTVDEDVPWDINLGTPDTETAEAELPMVIKLNLGYKLLTNADGGFFTKGSRYWKTDFGASTE